jgi:hypothetical protein
MTRDDPVQRALAALAEADASRSAPPHLESAVLDALDRQKRTGFLGRWLTIPWTYRAAAVAIALGVIVATATYLGVVSDVFNGRSRTTDRMSHVRSVDQPSIRLESDTFSSSQRQGDLAYRVLVRLPRTMLPMLGVPIINPDAPGTVNIEVILREDGLAETIRVVP